MVLPLISATRTLARALERQHFGAPVTHVYNPLLYARAPHERYLDRFSRGRKRVVLLGMNPGPFGMAQTGVPFGEVSLVRDYLGIEAPVGKPSLEHPKRPVEGFACSRSEVSGRRLWGAIQATYPQPEDFFQEHFVANYCPLVFMESSGKNRTPDKLPAQERDALFARCDEYFRWLVDTLAPTHVLGIGKFAEGRARAALAARDDLVIAGLLHPSPASPKANAGWAAQADSQLRALGLPGFSQSVL